MRSDEIEEIVETHLCKLHVMFPSRILGGVHDMSSRRMFSHKYSCKKPKVRGHTKKGAGALGRSDKPNELKIPRLCSVG